jgi:low temperature requirement protein LtrA
MPARVLLPGVPTSVSLAPVQSGATEVRPFELFFDLVFAFSLIQITNTIVSDGDLLGVAHGLVVLCIVWLVWSGFTALANMGLPPGSVRDWRPPVFVLAMACMLLVAISIPTAFWEGDKLFAYSIGVLSITWFVAYLKLTAGFPELRRDVYRMSAVVAVLPLAIIIASYLPQSWFSVALLAVGLVGAACSFFVARSPLWPIGREHLAERYSLFIIIALGESLISIGLGATGSARGAELVIGIVISVLLVAVMWRAYLVGVYDTGLVALSQMDDARALRFSRIAYSYLHLVLSAGIILLAAGLKVAMKDVTTVITPLFGALLLAGLALFLVSILLFRHFAIGRWEWWRLLAIAGLLAVWVIGERIPDLVFLSLTTAVAVLGSLPDLRRPART